MFNKKSFHVIGVTFCAGLLTSCIEATLPRFDGGLMNPEIRFLRAGEILDCVKCAMTSFMDGREKKLHRERVEAFDRLPGKSYKRCPEKRDLTRDTEPLCDIEGAYFSPDQINVSKVVVQSFHTWSEEKITTANSYRTVSQYRKCPKDQHLAWKIDEHTKKM